jgi:cysteine-S-conjugate beta-lyase
MDWETRLIHSGFDLCKHTGAVSMPVYHASTYKQEELERPGPYMYGRSGNPTRDALEGMMAVLEGGRHGFAFSSGMGAIASALSLLSAGEHVLVSRDVYGGTYRALTSIFSRFGISHSFVDTTCPEALQAYARPETKALFLETPSNPTFRITDLAACAALARRHGWLTIADNTFMTPYLQRPLELGIDVVVHSATKFLGGHSDTIAGLAVVKDDELAGRLREVQFSFGAVLGPQDSWLVQRGIRTLKVRLDAQQKSAAELALWLSSHPAVAQVHYPGLPGHPGGDIHHKQCGGPGAVLSFSLARPDTVPTFLSRLTLPLLAVSLGGVETILSHPATMSHAVMPPDYREALGIGPALFRLSVGLESCADLQKDLACALES